MGLEVEVVGETNKFDVIVIGGGVAGMLASATVTQSGLKSCFLEKDVPGGKVMHIDQVNNWQSGPINGHDLGLSLFKQVTEDIKTTYVYGNVTAIKPKNGLFYLYTDDGQTWEAKAIILATGTVTSKLKVDNEEKYIGHGISYCVTCDASLTKDKKVVLVGNQNHLSILQQHAKSVETVDPNDVEEIIGDGTKVTGIKTKSRGNIDCDFVFVELGYKPNTDFLPQEIKLDEKNQIIVDDNMASPYLEGVFAAGDCINQETKMITPAMSQAQTAATSAVAYINSKKW